MDERGNLGLEEMAEPFGVSYGYTKRIRRQQLRSRQSERVAQSRYGPVSRVTAEVKEPLRAELRQPDLTLAELGRATAEQPGAGVEQDAVIGSAARAGVAA